MLIEYQAGHIVPNAAALIEQLLRTALRESEMMRRCARRCAECKRGTEGRTKTSIPPDPGVGGGLETTAGESYNNYEPRARLPVRPGGLCKRRLDGILPVSY